MSRLFLIVAMLALASCSTGGSPAAPEATSKADRAGAPLVTAPRDLTSRASDPCRALLTEDQLTELGYDEPGESRTSSAGTPSCQWRDRATGRQVSVGVSLGRDLFVQTYRNRVLPEFRELRISGLPAADISAGRQAFTCTTTVGVAEADALDVTGIVRAGRDGRPASDPCEEGHRVAEAIVSTLPPK